MDPVALNLHMTEKSDLVFNPYLVNSQMKKLTTESSRSFDFKPSVPDYSTSRLAEFTSGLNENSYFRPLSQFRRKENSIPDESNIIEKPYLASEEVDEVDPMQRINNLESDIIFKPYFVAQPSRSFQMPETSSNRYVENDVQVIDLSQF
ncbi:hypothetical protein WA026_009650 [Henosepilachna vigintioctopunctata]|uniref:Uncharacterized protein n=1 Tax=Henosepilachna vigintioctopunctata TaxID=420089 RepID=A0AAW1U4G4_9CUCU